ncbi:MAG TPA: crossover junction endodeoxyribonuclease RuvC [Clostridia bacterium]
MIIMGFDPGIATLGYGVIQKDNLGQVKPLDFGVITTPKDMTMSQRLCAIYDSINALIQKYNPDAIAIEELFFNTNSKTAIQVAQARGIIILCSAKGCKRLYEYTPLQIKQAMTGNGRAEKHQIQFMVRMMLGLKTVPKPDDAADALAVALTHAQTNDLTNQNML